MDAGISTACFFPMETEKTLEYIQKCHVQACEIFLQAESEYNKDFVKVLRTKCDENNLKATSVHAFGAAFEDFLFSGYTRRRKDSLRDLERVCIAAKILGAPVYTFHGERLRGNIDSLDYKAYQRYFQDILDISESYGILLAWENVAWCQSANPLFIQRIKEYVDPGRLHYTFDSKQARRAGISMEDYIKVMGNGIVNVHICDFHDKSDCILPGRGQEEFPALFHRLRNLGYNGSCIIEVYGDCFKEYTEIGQAAEYIKRTIKEAST